MRVLFNAHLYPPAHNAGAEWMVHSLLRALVGRGHQVTVQLSRHTGGEDYVLDGVAVQVARPGDIWQAADYDLVLAHLENVPRTVVAARLLRVPFGIVCHNTYPPTRAWLVDDAALVVFNSEWMQICCGGHRRGVVVHPPVHAGDYATTPGDRVTLVNLNEAKGGALFAELADRMPDVRFLGVVGAYGEQVLPATRNVELLEHVDGRRMAELVYARTRVLLMPSVYESWGRVGVEAMCSGIPVIAHPTPGLVESLGTAGTFVHRDDPDAWETHIRRLTHPAEWRRASARAAVRAAQLDPASDLDRWCAAVESV